MSMNLNQQESRTKVKTFITDASQDHLEVLDSNLNSWIYREKIKPSDIIDIKVTTVSQPISSTGGAIYVRYGEMRVIYTVIYLSAD